VRPLSAASLLGNWLTLTCLLGWTCFQALESSCREAVDVPAEGGVMTITSTLPSGGDIGELWSAMKVAGLLDKHCQWIAGVCSI
jgi:hypothetical protein